MIIKLYDNEEYDYPLVSIWKEDFEQFKKLLKEYQKDEEYNFDDFLILLRENDVNVRQIEIDRDIYF